MSTSSLANRISSMTSASPTTRTPARCCVRRMMTLPTPTTPECSHGFAKQRVRFVAALGRQRGSTASRSIGSRSRPRVTKSMMSIVLRRVERGLLEVIVREHDELSLLVLVAFHDLVPGHRLAVCLADSLVLDRRQIFGVQHSEADVIAANRGLHLDGNVDQSEGQ